MNYGSRGKQKKTKQRNFALTNVGSPLEHGKLPPQAVDLEEAVLGALMLEREAVNTAIDILQPKVFTKKVIKKYLLPYNICLKNLKQLTCLP